MKLTIDTIALIAFIVFVIYERKYYQTVFGWFKDANEKRKQYKIHRVVDPSIDTTSVFIIVGALCLGFLIPWVIFGVIQGVELESNYQEVTHRMEQLQEDLRYLEEKQSHEFYKLQLLTDELYEINRQTDN